MPLPDEQDWLDIQHRVDKLEEYGERDTADITSVKQDIESLRSELSELRNIIGELFALSEALRNFTVQAFGRNDHVAKDIDNKILKMLEGLKTRLRP
jgi:ferredoxin-fold anticodon binding domain-containing protein